MECTTAAGECGFHCPIYDVLCIVLTSSCSSKIDNPTSLEAVNFVAYQVGVCARRACVPGGRVCQVCVCARRACVPGRRVCQVGVCARWACVPGGRVCMCSLVSVCFVSY